MGEDKTPGVYIKENTPFGNSPLEVETAIPVFIGLTEKAEDGSRSLLNQPVRINSMAEYYHYFGGAKTHQFNVSVGTTAQADALCVNSGSNELQAKRTGSLCTLYYHLTLFFANGGGTCYLVSVGDYNTGAIAPTAISNVLPVLKEVENIAMILVPEAAAVAAAVAIYQNLLGWCESKQCFAILDIPTKYNDGVKGDTDVEKFRTAIGTTNLQFAAAYYPWLETSVLSDNDIDGAIMYFNKAQGNTYSGNASLDKYIVNSLAEIDKAKDYKGEQKKRRNDLHNTLLQSWREYQLLTNKVKASLNLLPPSAAMAGIYAMIDNTHGVWKAPANVTLNRVNKPAEVIADKEQEELNMPMNGKAVNAIRTFPGEGIKVWGARTLDANSLDWRYINVRRTMIFLEKSVKNIAHAYVLESNDAGTWISMKCMIENFLRGVWRRGGLAGATREDAYEVHIGLGDTMTTEDILEGIMRITILVAITRPAEFLEIIFQQQMQKTF